jgi:hypothetical protein
LHKQEIFFWKIFAQNEIGKNLPGEYFSSVEFFVELIILGSCKYAQHEVVVQPSGLVGLAKQTKE